MIHTLWHNFRSWKVWAGGVILIGLLLIATQCSPTATPIAQDTPPGDRPPEITGFTLSPSDPVFPLARINIQVNVNRNGHKIDNYRWVVGVGEGGIVNGQGTSLITYEASETPGTYEVRVELEYEGGPPVVGSTEVEVLPEPTPTSTGTSTPTDTPSPNTPTATATPAQTPKPAPDAVIVASVSLRSGPGTAYEIISTLSPNQVLTVTGRIADATWLQVNTDQMQEGWIVNRADLVTLNLPIEQIPIVSPPPAPTPTPTPLSFQNFEPDNGTSAPYFEGVWKMNCEFEYEKAYQGSRSLKCRAHWGEDDCPDCHGGTVRIYPSSAPIDLSSATTLSIWVYDTQGNNTVSLRLRDNNDALSNEVWSEMHAEQNDWTEITWSLSDFTGVDLSRIRNIELYEWWDGVYYFDAVSWQSLEPITCPYQADTDAETIVRLIQAESEAVKKEDISIIQAIFAEDAIIRDALSGDTWNDPMIRYEALFANVDFTHAIRPEIQPAGDGITANAAWFISGSRGSYEGVGFSGSYDNPPGSDHWTFGKNSFGCWIITEFTFNASHIPFPP